MRRTGFWNSHACINAGRSLFKLVTETVYYKLKLKWLDIFSWTSLISDKIKTCLPILWVKHAGEHTCVGVSHIVHDARENPKTEHQNIRLQFHFLLLYDCGKTIDCILNQSAEANIWIWQREWRKLHNEDFCNVQSSPSIIKAINQGERIFFFSFSDAPS